MAQQLTNPTIICELCLKESMTTTFEEVLTETIDEVFQSLGENVKQSMYRYLESNFGIRKMQIPAMIEGFTCAIESIFGCSAKLVELKIMEKLQGKVQGFTYKPKNKDILFTEYLGDLQKYLNL